MASFLAYVHILAGAVLVGKVVLLSFVVAPILAKSLEREPFGNVVRQLFPAYYGWGMGTLIRHYVQIFDVRYIRGQVYLNPHPKELMLRNHV
ncbi:MAG: conserved rane protein of unknown function [Nitrospira sp.]|jgi:hypothetical protein|nr:conserved rane protein of unknown function [Nitrospira sp.]